METNYTRATLTTAIAPAIWGSTYYITRNFLPADYPLTGSAIRALPAGLLLLVFTRTLPTGSWWWRTLAISSLTISGFFTLIYIAGTRLPSSLASMLMALSPIVTMLLALLILGEKLPPRRLLGGILGIAGVFLLVGGIQGEIDWIGALASFGGMASSALGFVLTKRWNPPVNSATFTSWQLTLGGLVLLPLALILEGTMPPQSTSAYLGFAYVVIFASITAYVCWFYGVAKLPAGTVSIIGLLNPLTGALLGTALAHEQFSIMQWCGCVVLLSGIVLGTVTTRNARKVPQ